MRIEEIKQQYKDEWVLVEILREDKLNRPIDVELIAHSKDREDIYKAMKGKKFRYTYHFYNGKAPKGYIAAF